MCGGGVGSRRLAPGGQHSVQVAAGEHQPELIWGSIRQAAVMVELALVDAAPVAAFCRAQARDAAAAGDGNRAWVLRDSLTKLPAADADAVRTALAGVRRTAGAPSTSSAAAAFLSAAPDRPGAPPP